MLVILSPARQIHAEPGVHATTTPCFLDRAACLIERLRGFDAWQLERMLRCNDRLAVDAAVAHAGFDPAAPGTPALLAYQGLCYHALDAAGFTAQQRAFADERIRILSALYGCLRATDGIQPYRLELCSRLEVDGGNLYTYWGSALRDALFAEGQPVLNLASKEYARAAQRHLRPGDRFVTVEFLVPVHGKLKGKGTLVKQARGWMARYVVERRLERPEQVQRFDVDGYRFEAHRSSEERYVFVKQV